MTPAITIPIADLKPLLRQDAGCACAHCRAVRDFLRKHEAEMAKAESLNTPVQPDK